MANLLGNYVLKASSYYKENKISEQSFEDFFLDYYTKNVSTDIEANNIIYSFLSDGFINITEDTNDDEIEVMLNSLYNTLLNKNLIKPDCNIGFVIGLILLGNIYSNKK